MARFIWELMAFLANPRNAHQDTVTLSFDEGDFIRSFAKDGTKVMIDPVMGDYGRLYSSYTKEMCVEMRSLLTYADLVTPNLTEACELLDIPYPDDVGKMQCHLNMPLHFLTRSAFFYVYF